MDVRARKINIEMKLAAAKALAELTKKEVPEYLHELYGKQIVFGKEYIIPKPFDKRLVVEISSAVALAAIESGSSTMKNFDIEVYKLELAKRV
jgi:malate dehydrogenase (oxaloacetate-decarboxylating)(NADP+)